ncbi:MAG: nucleotidyltransferase domain-containing protein [Patescibacteria group bacterium]
MAKKISFPKKIVNNYLKHLDNQIKIDKALLFGSYAWGKPTKHSDIDLVIISSDFQKQTFWKRVDWLTNMRDGIADTVAMDIIGYTPKEFTHIEKYSAIMAKAKKDGKWIYP